MDRIFLDANVLFSAAYRPDAGLARLARLWRLEGVELITSAYAAEEAKLNLTEEDQRARLTELLQVSGESRMLGRAIFDKEARKKPLALAADVYATSL